MSLATITPTQASSGEAVPVAPPIAENDIIEPIPWVSDPGPSLTLEGAADPLGLIPHPDEVRRYTLGKDVFEVWECPDAGAVPISAADFVAEAETRMTAYFSWISDGRYDPDFVVGGAVPGGSDCATHARAATSGSADAALFIRNNSGGFAGPGLVCNPPGSACGFTPKYPSNFRDGYIGVLETPSGTISWTTLAHEMGHMLSWPHSYTHSSNFEYDNAIDLMSGNYNRWTVGNGTLYGSYPYPYATIVINRYAAGWIDPDDMALWNGGSQTVTLHEIGVDGTQGFVVDTGDEFFVLGARISSANDPFPPVWNGVEVYEVDRCDTCWSLNADVRPKPAVPFAWQDQSMYGQPLDHVLGIGESIVLGDATVTVSSSTSDSFTLTISGEGDPPPLPARFVDVPRSHLFFDEIEWLADRGITVGCNPSEGNTEFCPDDRVTRGQFAAFMKRAFGWSDDGGGDLFLDDDDSVFERDIDILATAGVTRGCNPPGNDRYCPEANVTRGQFAAFFSRAFGYTDDGGGDLFLDDDDSVFERDIDRLATEGITKGCDPPDNERFCPDSYLTRGQLAAFFYRAFN
ncbi:MAG: S-layer homology domain-containing protein [Acidimicrobiia bacterium]|nr:S-layer homology domain-containing protein [Acidimicrobiia bacterium]